MTKREYINSITHDLEYYRSAKGAACWHHGVLLTRFQVCTRIKEFEKELTKIQNDKTYKPWKEIKL